MAEHDHVAAHDASFRNREQILRSDRCGCFYCLAVFPPSAIRSWVSEYEPKGQTARCPQCDIDSVIGSASEFPVTEGFLRRMQEYWCASAA